MGQEQTRAGLQRALMLQARRLGQHIKHLDRHELPALNGIVDELEQMHTDNDHCQRQCQRHSDTYRPWGTRYASPGVRFAHAFSSALRTVFPKKR